MVGSWVEHSDSDTRKTGKLQAIRILCNRLLVNRDHAELLMRWANESSIIVDIIEFLIQKLSVVFATKSLLKLGGDACDNLNFMNFKIDNFKIR